MMQNHFIPRFVLAMLVASASVAVQSRAVVIEETQWLEAPQAGLTYLGDSVAIEGDWALATALFSADRTYEYPYRQLALLYRRSGNTWVFDRVLVDDATDAVSWNDPRVAMANGLASVSTSPLRVFQRTGDEWTALPAPFSSRPSDASWANGLTRIDGTTVASISGRCNFSAITSDRLAGAWTAPEVVNGNPRICTLSNYSGSMDIDSNRLVLTSPQEDQDHPPSETRIFQRSAPGQPWRLEARLAAGEYGFGVALRDDELFIGGWSPLGNDIYRRGADGWTHAGRLPTLAGFDPYYLGASHFAKSGEFLLAPTSTFDGLPAGVAVYRREPGGSYRHVAQLASSRGDSLGPVAEISGRTIIVGGWSLDQPDRGRLYFFELPAGLEAPAPVEDDFEDGDAGGWNTRAGSFSVARRGASLVLRQSDTAGVGVAVLSDSGSPSQAVEADIRPLAFGADPGIGLATRFLDGANYYVALLRGSGVVELRRLRAGVSVPLASRPFEVSANARYRLRLESVGSRHRVYVNDARMIDVIDGTLDAGRVAVFTRRASAEFDNVLVTSGHRTPLYSIDILTGSDCERFTEERLLRQTGTPAWDCTDYEAGYLRQASLDGVARAAIGPVTGDQAVETRVQLEEFADGGASDKWLGVMTRYRDENNYYYFVLRSSKVMSLRKLVDGVITELGRASFTLGSGGWHTLRLEAVGSRLRGYVNGQLVIQAEDSSHPTGISGIATYRAAARFDYLRIVQP